MKIFFNNMNHMWYKWKFLNDIIFLDNIPKWRHFLYFCPSVFCQECDKIFSDKTDIIMPYKFKNCYVLGLVLFLIASSFRIGAVLAWEAIFSGSLWFQNSAYYMNQIIIEKKILCKTLMTFCGSAFIRKNKTDFSTA